jgi:hypothetical protein
MVYLVNGKNHARKSVVFSWSNVSGKNALQELSIVSHN